MGSVQTCQGEWYRVGRTLVRLCELVLRYTRKATHNEEVPLQLRLSFHAIKALREAKPFPYKAGGRGAVFVSDEVYEEVWSKFKQSGQKTFHNFIMEWCRGVSEAVGKERARESGSVGAKTERAPGK
jgi:hypothetical protein